MKYGTWMGVLCPFGFLVHPCFFVFLNRSRMVLIVVLFFLSWLSRVTVLIGVSHFRFSCGDVQLAGLAVGIMFGSLFGVFRLVTRWCDIRNLAWLTGLFLQKQETGR